MSNETAPAPSSASAFEERYKIDMTKPLQEFNSPGGSAYLVTDRDKPSRPLYAFVHHQMVPFRNDVYAKLIKSPIGNLVCPIDRGLSNVQLSGKRVQRLITIFERPTGGPLFSTREGRHERVKPALIRQNVVVSVLKALAALHKRGIMHRHFTVDKLFFASPGSEEVMIGECYTAPAGYRVPFAAEPLETAFADEVGRGESAAMADFFQFGVALQSLYYGTDFTADREKDSLLIARVNQGSYWANSGGQDVPGALGTLVRGLMADELEERWVAEDVLDWYEGLAKQKRTTMKAWTMNRPTTYKGVAYVDRRLLADALSKDPRDAASFLRQLDFTAWVQHSMRDEIVSERLENSIGISQGSQYGTPSTADDARMVARVCMFLHPTGPIRYKGLALYLDSVGGYLADAYARDDRDRITTLVEILDTKFLAKIREVVGDHDPMLLTLMKALKPAMDAITSKQLGAGMERALYRLNPTMPCASQRFENVWIGSLKQMLGALDRIAEQGGGRNVLSDRHVAAFMATHGSDLDREFNKLAAAQNDPSRFAMLTVEFFGMLQRSVKVGSLPHLTEKLADALTPVVKGLRNKKRRETVIAALEKMKKGGDLSKLAADLNLTSLATQDAREFSRARTEIMKIDKEKARLSRKIQPNDPDATAQGYRGARVVAGLIFIGVGIVTFFGTQ